MYEIGEKIIYGENGVCTVEKIAPLESGDGKLYYYLRPLIGSGTYFAPVDTKDSIPDIQPAICSDNRFNHVDAFYKELFKQHSCEALVSIVKGLSSRMSQRKTKSSRAEAIMKRARDMLHGELATALGLEVGEVEDYISRRLESAE